MYWILMSERSDEYEVSIDVLPPDVEKHDLHFDYGNIVTSAPAAIDVPFPLHPEERMTDNVVSPTRLGLLINSKVKSVFDSFNIKNIQYFKAHLIEKNGQNIAQDYCVANVVGKFSCVDHGSSTLEYHDDGDIFLIDKLVLELKDGVDYGHIFRLAEFPPILVISEPLKAALEESGITGFKYYPSDNFIM